MKDQTKQYFKELLNRHNDGERMTRAEHSAFCFFQGGGEDFTINDIVWEDEIPTLAEIIRAAGIESFLVTDHSTALMKTMHGLAAQGFIFRGLDTYTRRVHKYGADTDETVYAVRFDVR
jgi:hypothetical protein